MAAKAVLNISLVYDNDVAASIAQRAMQEADIPRRAIELLRTELARFQGGNSIGKVHAHLDQGDGTAAVCRVACSQASVSAGDTVTVCGVVFTVATSPSTNPALGQFAAGASDTACAANLAAAINAHPLLQGLLTAAGSTGNCNITATDKGLHGNLMTLAKTGSGFTLTQVASLTRGVQGTVQAEIRCYPRGMA